MNIDIESVLVKNCGLAWSLNHWGFLVIFEQIGQVPKNQNLILGNFYPIFFTKIVSNWLWHNQILFLQGQMFNWAPKTNFEIKVFVPTITNVFWELKLILQNHTFTYFSLPSNTVQCINYCRAVFFLVWSSKPFLALASLRNCLGSMTYICRTNRICPLYSRA